MTHTQSHFDWQFALDIGHYIVVPLIIYIWHKVNQTFDHKITVAVNSGIDRIRIEMGRSNDELIEKINGTYIRSKEFVPRHDELVRRVESLEHRKSK